jgi:hypothetical protein
MKAEIEAKLEMLRIDEYDGDPVPENLTRTRWYKIETPRYDENGSLIIDAKDLKNTSEATPEEVRRFLKGEG